MVVAAAAIVFLPFIVENVGDYPCLAIVSVPSPTKPQDSANKEEVTEEKEGFH
jgi:hypothetical protein